MKVLIEADGGSRGNPGPAGYGAVVFTADHGNVLGERKQAIGVATNNVAEYNGLLAGLIKAYDVVGSILMKREILLADLTEPGQRAMIASTASRPR